MSAAGPEPRFFMDRGLGSLLVPDGLRAAGWQVVTMDERYGPRRSQGVSDVDWIRDASQRGECLLTKDAAVASRPAEAEAIYMNDSRVFALARANVIGPTMLMWFLANERAIHRMTRAKPPFVMAVGPDRLRRKRLAYP